LHHRVCEGVNPHETVVVVKRILVPIDRSEYKEKIAAYAISLAKAWEAEMTVVHVVEPRHGLPNGVEAEAMEITKNVLGENHPDYATSLNNLAELYHTMGDYSKAEPLYQKALEITKNVLGENHPDYATSLNNLAMLYKNMGDYSKAEPLIQKALEIAKNVLGESLEEVNFRIFSLEIPTLRFKISST
jgi:tetratricopeptide (TPR) repeat protein